MIWYFGINFFKVKKKITKMEGINLFWLKNSEIKGHITLNLEMCHKEKKERAAGAKFFAIYV